MKLAPKKKQKPPPGTLCTRTVRRSDETENPCLLEFDHDILVFCQDQRALDARGDLEIYGERVAMLPDVVRLFGVWPPGWISDDVRRFGWHLVWTGRA